MRETCSPSKVEILFGNGEHLEPCLNIGESLPEYFNEVGLKEMRRSLLGDKLYVAVEDRRVIGFATVGNENNEKAEITWFAVASEHQGNGIGRSLVARIEKELAEKGVKLLTVKTLSKETNYPPFEATRRFYERNDFVHVETVNPYPGWGGDPAAIYAKTLSTGRTG